MADPSQNSTGTPDTTTTADAVAALRRELAERDDLFALLTHELRNPLHVLKLQLELACLSAESGDMPDTRRKIDKVRALMKRYTKRVTLMLDLMGRKNGYPVQARQVDLVAMLSELAEGLRLEAGFHRIALSCELPPAPVVRTTDPQALEQIVENLLLNAFKHSSGSQVRLLLRPAQGGQTEIEIADNGKGISKEDLPRLYRKHEVGRGNDHTHGTGLGLWIIQNLVAALGATLRLDTDVGQGCRFTVVLPAMPPSPQQAS